MVLLYHILQEEAIIFNVENWAINEILGHCLHVPWMNSYSNKQQLKSRWIRIVKMNTSLKTYNVLVLYITASTAKSDAASSEDGFWWWNRRKSGSGHKSATVQSSTTDKTSTDSASSTDSTSSTSGASTTTSGSSSTSGGSSTSDASSTSSSVSRSHRSGVNRLLHKPGQGKICLCFENIFDIPYHLRKNIGV